MGGSYFLDADHRVHALSASDGDGVWTQALRAEVVGATGTRAAAASPSAVGACLSPPALATWPRWMPRPAKKCGARKRGAPFHSAPTVVGGRVFAITNDSELIAYDAGSGAVQWTHQAIAETARILSAPSVAVDGETVVAPFASGEIVALLDANGRRLWSDSLSRSGQLTSLSAINDIAGRPVLDNGVVFAGSHSGVLAAIDLRTGQRIWARAFASTQTPWIGGDVLYAVSVDGELAAFDRATGNVYWVRATAPLSR